MDSLASNIHATCVVLGDAGRRLGVPPATGILLTGPSGVGKSDLAIQLINRGAVLVADDRTELYVNNSALIARAPKRLRGLIEVRGVGILTLPYRGKAAIDLVVALQDGPHPRLPEQRFYDQPPASTLPPDRRPALLCLDPRGASAPEKVIVGVLHLAQTLVHKQ